MCFTVRVVQYVQSTYFFCGSSHVYTYDINFILHTDLYTSETHCLIIFQNKSKKLKKNFSLIMACCVFKNYGVPLRLFLKTSVFQRASLELGLWTRPNQ